MLEFDNPVFISFLTLCKVLFSLRRAGQKQRCCLHLITSKVYPTYHHAFSREKKPECTCIRSGACTPIILSVLRALKSVQWAGAILGSSRSSQPASPRWTDMALGVRSEETGVSWSLSSGFSGKRTQGVVYKLKNKQTKTKTKK